MESSAISFRSKGKNLQFIFLRKTACEVKRRQLVVLTGNRDAKCGAYGGAVLCVLEMKGIS